MGERISDEISKDGVAARLQITRDALGLSQKEFAERAGIAPNTYNQYEGGVNYPKIELAISICEAFDLTLDWIFRADPSGLRYDLADAIRAIRSARKTTKA